MSSARRQLRRARRGAAKARIGVTSSLYRGQLSDAVEAPDATGEGPGGPILVLAHASNAFGRYLAEILLAEGLNAFAVTDVGSVTAEMLARHEVVLLGEMPLGAQQAATLADWVGDGGNLVAMRPSPHLAGLLGLEGPLGVLAEGYLKVDASAPPGKGITTEPLRFHGAADRYRVVEGRAIATLYPSRAGAEGDGTVEPAVVVRSVGSRGGHAAAFTYDLARSVVYTRQGNPALASRRPAGPVPRRSSDWFRAAEPGGQDWVDLEGIGVPQADEQQRLLANVIAHVTRERLPLPRFWYFPRGVKAVVILTGDDHGGGGTSGRFQSHRAASPPGSSVDDWTAVRSSSYVSLETPLSDQDAAAFAAEGFEVGLHVSSRLLSKRGRGANWTPASLRMFYGRQLQRWRARYPSLPAPSTVRTHSVVWTDWATQPKVELAHGIRLDTNYYHWPAEWLADRHGFLTGSGIPMRFADLDGTSIDVYQAATHLTDESGQRYPEAVEFLLDRAVGPEAYVGAFTANAHTDRAASAVSDAIVAAALERGVPVVSARQMLEWLDGRNGSTFEDIRWDGGRLRFDVRPGRGARGLVAMVPARTAGAAVSAVERDGDAIAFRNETFKGVGFVRFPAAAGSYVVVYGSPSVPTPEGADTATDRHPERQREKESR